MPELPEPTPPVEQVALRQLLDALARRSNGSLECTHQDRFWESADGRESVYGWGTAVRAVHRRTSAVQVWFDGLDHDVTVTTGAKGRRPLWSEWRDLADIERVLKEVQDEVLQQLRAIGVEVS
jgi:hypothetical protein